ncbi:hypothetical protein P7C70_g6818, partial [Phenoliferia sp. Uapishka_3]
MPRPRLRPPAPLTILPPFRAFSTSLRPSFSSRETHGSAPSSSPPPSSSSPPPPPPSPPQVIVTSSPSAPPPFVAPAPSVPFSTQTFIRKIERRSGGTMGRGVAQVLMEATRDLIKEEERRVGNEAWRKGDLENEAYLFTAALSELKTSSQVKSRNDSTILRSMTAVLQRETDAVEQRLKEDVHRLRSDIQELNGKFTILLGEARTEIETVRWVSTRRVMSTLVILVVGVVGAMSYSPSKSTDSSTDDSEAASMPTLEEFGVRRTTDGIEADATGGRGWFWGGGRVEGESGGGEVGEESGERR